MRGELLLLKSIRSTLKKCLSLKFSLQSASSCELDPEIGIDLCLWIPC